MTLLKNHEDYPWEFSKEELKTIVTDDEACPSETKSCEYLLAYSRKQHRQAIRMHGAITKSELGKWMLYLDNENVDDAWEQAKKLYRKGRLPGVRFLRVSCNVGSPYELSPYKKVIFFYAGPADEEEAVMDVGENILEKMQHERQECDAEVSYFCFKEESQKLGRNYSGGRRSKYVIRMPY